MHAYDDNGRRRECRSVVVGRDTAVGVPVVRVWVCVVGFGACFGGVGRIPGWVCEAWVVLVGRVDPTGMTDADSPRGR